MEFAVEETLDELYTAKPEDFTALRATLAAAAKKRGDAEAAKRITASRKPTAAAWVVNALALGGTARTELADLGSRLREAHAAMDGEAIRTLTAEQRTLVDTLTRTALRQAGLAAPSAALRDDVTATLQAAVADPDVAARLGRLTKAEQWSGFGEFGFTATVSAVAKTKTAKPPAPAARAALSAAERTKADVDAALPELQSDLAAARLRHQDAQRRLAAAEQALTAAEEAYAAGKQASQKAAEAVKVAKRAMGR